MRASPASVLRRAQRRTPLAQGCRPIAGVRAELRSATADDAEAIHRLISANVESGHLLPRTLDELRQHASRFVVASSGGHVLGCGELAPLSQSVAEVRSLVVDETSRGRGLGHRILDELISRARAADFLRLCAFTSDPRPFERLRFSIVPHAWVPEKIATDCGGCALFRRCGQHAMLLALPGSAS